MNRVQRSILFSAVERYASVLIAIASTAVLARLLSPAEFGIYAVISGLTAVASASFQEFGGANYIIQKPTLSERDIRTAFTVTFGMSLAFAAVLFAGRHALTSFFDRPGLDHGLAVLSSTFLITPFSVTSAALFRREMAFGRIATGTFAANLVNASFSVALASLGFSFMAPIWGAVFGAATLALFLLLGRASLRIFQPCLEGVSGVLHFGAYSSAVVIVNVFSQSLPQFILGRVSDFNSVGLFGRSASITQLFDRLVLQVLNPVIMPALFAESRAGGDLKRIYLGSLELISALQWPFLAVLAALCEPIIAVWLGPAWMPVVPLVRCLGIASMALFGACLTYPLLVAIGRIQDTLIVTLITLPPSVLVICLAAPHGAGAVAASALVTFPLQAAVSIGAVARRLDIAGIELVRSVRKSVLVTVLTLIGPATILVIVHLGPHQGPLGPAGLCGAGLVAGVGWLVGLSATQHPLMNHLRKTAMGIAARVRRLISLLRGAAAQNAGSV